MFGLEPVTTHSRNISSAVFRVAELIRHKKLRAEVESAAVNLVRDLDGESIQALDRLVRLAEAVGEMNSTNSEVICRELGNLADMIREKEVAESKIDDNLTIESMFSGNSTEDGEGEAEKSLDVPKIESDKEDFALDEVFEKQTDSSDSNESLKAGERQAAILEFIRQFPGKCRMKNVVAEFDDFSERTLRTDIQKLIGSRLVERRGGKSGPSSYFAAVDAHALQEDYLDEDSEDSPEEPVLLPESTAGQR